MKRGRRTAPVVMPAKAGIQIRPADWIPAFAGMAYKGLNMHLMESHA
jgi:hypothetical protein